jgi:transposase
MGQNFTACDRAQELLLPPSLREWLPEDHLAWFVLDAVAELDREPFYAAYRRDGWGAAVHDPRMMVALLVYAYAVGERSSRAIERRCREDVAFRVIGTNQIPDHATVARFRVRHEAGAGRALRPGAVALRGRRPRLGRGCRGRWQQVRRHRRARTRARGSQGQARSRAGRRGLLVKRPQRLAQAARHRPDRRARHPGKGPRKTRLGGPYDFMRRVIAGEQGGALYSQRQWMVEPVFAQINTNRRIDRFKRRSLAAARSEWRLIAATHNLLKLHRHTLQTAGA